MPQVISRVNGLKINIPADARNIVHRFAIGGGGNELVFEPITRKTFDASKQDDQNPVDIGSVTTTEQDEISHVVELSENVVDDGDAATSEEPVDAASSEEPVDAAPAKKSTRAPRKKAGKNEADAIL